MTKTLGLVARKRGNLEEAIKLLEMAREAVVNLAQPFLQTQIDLRLAELYLERGDKSAAETALNRTGGKLTQNKWANLQAWAKRVQGEIEQS